MVLCCMVLHDFCDVLASSMYREVQDAVLTCCLALPSALVSAVAGKTWAAHLLGMCIWSKYV